VPVCSFSVSIPVELSVPGMPQNDIHGPVVYLIAGEPSGDALGGRLMAALKQETVGNIRFAGVGGPEMQAEGLTSLFPMSDLAVMGLAEVVPRLPLLTRRIRQTRENIRTISPNALVTIDAPDFSFRVARALTGENIPLIHYVAPSVWAWRPGRARKIAAFLDHLLTLLPFEPPYFEREGLSCTFVGHPVIEGPAMQADGVAFRKRHGIAPSETIVVALPGSRAGEVSRHLPIFEQTFTRLAKRHEHIRVVVIAAGLVADTVQTAANQWQIPTKTIADPAEKYHAMAAGNIALAASGTVALELAAVGTPAVITYRVNPITAWIGRRLIRIRFASLVNLILDREATPERLQNECRAEILSAELHRLLSSPDHIRQQQDAYRDALQHLTGQGDGGPSRQAARAVLRIINNLSK